MVEGDDPGALGEGRVGVAGADDLDGDRGVDRVLGEGEGDGAQVVVGDRGEDEWAGRVPGEAGDRGPAHDGGAGEVEREGAVGVQDVVGGRGGRYRRRGGHEEHDATRYTTRAVVILRESRPVRSDRLLATLLLLQTHGRLPAPEIARRLEVSTRTVARDVEALSAAGVPVYAERGRLGGVVLMPGFRTDVSGLTDSEMRALLALTDGEQGGSLGRAVGSAVRKLLAAVPEARRSGIAAARRTVVVEQYGWHRAGRPADGAPALGELERAVAADERVRIRYRSAAEDTGSWRTVDPYGLVSKAGTWYLVAAARGTPRMFRVSRVEEVAATGTPAHRPDDRDLEQVWIELRDRLERAPEAVTVRVRVDPARRAMVERVVAGQLVGPPEGEDEPDVVRLPFRAAGAAVGSLLGFGAVLEVLGPPEVRALMAERAAEAVGLYG